MPRFFYEREELFHDGEPGDDPVEIAYCVYDVFRGSEYEQRLASCGCPHVAEKIVDALNAMAPPAKPKISLGIFG